VVPRKPSGCSALRSLAPVAISFIAGQPYHIVVCEGKVLWFLKEIVVEQRITGNRREKEVKWMYGASQSHFGMGRMGLMRRIVGLGGFRLEGGGVPSSPRLQPG
jgi:hypothetical protein